MTEADAVASEDELVGEDEGAGEDELADGDEGVDPNALVANSGSGSGSDDDDDDDDDDGRVNPDRSRDVLEFLVKSLVDDPSAVDVEVDDRGRKPTLNVSVAQGDMGRIIGRRGHIAQSIRRVTRAAAVKDGTEINIEFLD